MERTGVLLQVTAEDEQVSRMIFNQVLHSPGMPTVRMERERERKVSLSLTLYANPSTCQLAFVHASDMSIP